MNEPEELQLGRFDLCLDIKDINKSYEFYKKMGFKEEEGNLEENWMVLSHGNLRLGLYQGHIEDKSITLNFRGGNVGSITSRLKEMGYEFTKEKSNDDGSGSAVLFDQDGYSIFFDTALPELDLIEEMNKNPEMFSLEDAELKLGITDVCLDVSNIAHSVDFFERLGLTPVNGNLDEGWVVLSHNNLRLALFKGEDNNLTINFRGGDVYEITEELKHRGFQFQNDAKEEEDGSVGSSLYDPDGYYIQFSTHPSEHDHYKNSF